MAKKLSRFDFQEMKDKGVQCAWVTAYDYPTASFAEAAGMDMILVGDSMGMIVFGYDGTVPVTMEQCIMLTKAARAGAPNTWLIGDMPFMSYHTSVSQAIENAGRFIKEAGADCIKLEGGVRVADKIRGIVDAGIVVMGHVGLTPQSSAALGGFKAQGRDVTGARAVINDAIAVYEAGAFSMLVEGVPEEVTSFLAKKLPIPIYGIGAGLCDGQVQVVGDLLGMFTTFTPKFGKKYANLEEIETNAFKNYIADVKAQKYPADEHKYHIFKGEEEALKKLLEEYK
ncbi:MAG: 3-methyl-2-oxobutanoate hydroxymethyltransferase [Deltaproteobacteria bacterium]|jgi:3-methyl-2-oxobutanoate hydroxymethyltransferase|nr:3-methyl-2-oxobutanoate hydroxymethyltransferase [Deltaproteobacteria bacterium]